MASETLASQQLGTWEKTCRRVVGPPKPGWGPQEKGLKRWVEESELNPEGIGTKYQFPHL